MGFDSYFQEILIYKRQRTFSTHWDSFRIEKNISQGVLGGGRKGVKDVRQGTGFVNWNVSISPFTASMAMSVEVPEHTRSSGALKVSVEGENPWETMGWRIERRDPWQPNPTNEAKSQPPYWWRLRKWHCLIVGIAELSLWILNNERA